MIVNDACHCQATMMLMLEQKEKEKEKKKKKKTVPGRKISSSQAADEED